MAGLSKSAQAATLLRILANRAGYDISRDHFRHRVVYALEQAGVDCVLDIGANVGQFGVQLRRAGFRGHIHSVEPLRQAFAQLEHRGASDARWSAQRAAASDTVGTVDINVAENSVSSSVLPMLDRHRQAAPTAGYIGTEQVPCTTVDAIVAAFELRPERTMLKIDVQGYERQVLAGAALTLDTFAAVRMEMSLAPLYEGQLLLPEVVELMGKHDFELWHVEPGFVEPGTRRLLQVDGVFFKSAGSRG
jgi:FkbM family methyltransferase